MSILGPRALTEIQDWAKSDQALFSTEATNIINALVQSNRDLLKLGLHQRTATVSTTQAQAALLDEIEEFLNVVAHVCQVADMDDLRLTVVHKLEEWCVDKRGELKEPTHADHQRPQ